MPHDRNPLRSTVPFIDVMLALDHFLSGMERSLTGLKVRLSTLLCCERIAFLPGESILPSAFGWPRHLFESAATEPDIPILRNMGELIALHHANNHKISDYVRTLTSWFTSEGNEVVYTGDVASYFLNEQQLERQLCQSEILLLEFYLHSSDFQLEV